MTIWNSYRLFFTPLSPIHIGTGESYEPTNYVIEDGTLHEFDMSAMLNALAERDRQKLLELGNRRPDSGMLLGMQKFFYERRDRLIPWATHRIPVLQGVAALYASKVGQIVQQVGKEAVINKLEIDRTAYNPVTHRPILLGSSVKGAIRTALLDQVNAGKPPLRNEKDGLHPFQGRLFKYREPDRGRLFFERDPMRLIQLADAGWQDTDGLPTAEVFLAVNRKKDLVTDKQGNPRQSQAEAKHLYQILECVPPMQYRAFTAQLNVQGLGEAAGFGGVPASDMRFAMEQIAQACNAFYRPILETELLLLSQRGYLNTEWRRTINEILGTVLPGQKQVFLLRVGRHSGAESVTLNGVRNIKMKGRGQPPECGPPPKTVWLAADEPSQTSGLLPFGWLLVEYVGQEKVLPEQGTLKTICEAHGESGRAWSQTVKEKELAWEQIRHETEEQHRAETEQALRRAEEAARDAKQEAERQAKRAAMSPQELALEETQRLFEEERERGVLKPGSATINKLNQLLKDADDWPPDIRPRLAELAEKIFAHPSVGWGARDKARKRKARIKALKQKE